MVDDTKVYADAWLSSNKSSDEITVAPYDAWVVLMKVVTLQ